ncbi:MAG: tripartite tricarboxylate transporter substrate binding protein [Betaproteobacteria bacterium]|nr:tripartite tricarboxylate transporter substrate binding protein [Betaproteobacteria bacterium]MBI2223530.1 tripartite tricarboxylate transporter substrate binding protein [Betaproteobacteria bacterium]MBI2290252.1 tripartite tricarboxylate transporter substrate binding protein [Betaproteobacteria bacterium]MBI3057575.1 tripartite tricarboxylate transporter substrate binding protein [Betaproteobacteria bacterium]
MNKHMALLLPLLLLPTALPVGAQAYPAKPVRLIVPFPPGGPTDVVSRLMAPKMAEGLGQQVVVENRGGAGGAIGTEHVAKSAPDGYTIVMGTIGGLAVARSLNPKLGYDTLRDLAPITQSVSVTSILVTHPSVPAKNVKELLALAKKGSGKLNYASSGNGTITHLAGELLKLMAKVDIAHVPYKGGAPALVALVSGEVDMSYENSLIITPHIKSGKVKGLAVTSAKRSALMPELPTIAETLPGYSASGWYGLLAPAATPKPAIARLHSEAVKALRAPDVVEKLTGQGAEPVASTPEEFTAFIRSETSKWANLVKAANMRTD